MDVYGLITTIAVSAQAVTVVVAALYAGRQVNEVKAQVQEARRVRLLSILLAIRNDIDSVGSRRNRYRLFNELPRDLTSSLTEAQDRVVDRVVVEYEFIGGLIGNNFIDFEQIASLYAPSVERAWIRAKPWVESERKRRDDEPYATNFEKFSEDCMKYNRQRNRGTLRPFRRDNERT
jgi:hypothetical protein